MSQDRSHGLRDNVRRGRQLSVLPLITAAFVIAFAITDVRAQKPVAEPGACSFEPLDLDVDFQPTGTPATIYLQRSASVSLLFSAESLTSEGQRIDVRYSIDGGQPEVLGPEFFSTDTVDFATRTSLGLITLGAGLHTIEPFARSTASAGSSLFFRCFHLSRDVMTAG